MDFLRRYAPFNRMREDALRALVPRLTLASFAKDATILSTQSGPIADLHIIRRGLVGSRPNNTQANPDRTLGPGELFPVGALSAGGTTTKVFYALQDTACYLLAARGLSRVAAVIAGVRALLYAGHYRNPQAVAGEPAQPVQPARGGAAVADPHARRARAHPPVACAATATVREAGQKMADAKVRTIIALDPRRRAGRHVHAGRRAAPRDAARASRSRRRCPQAMSTPLVTLPASATAYEAMHVMAERGVRQIAVVENGRLKGVVNERDLFALQRVSMRQVNEGLHSADTLDKLKRAGDDIRLLTQNLLAQGVGAEPVTRTIAALNDALSRRVIDLVLERHDLARLRLVLARARQRGTRRADVRDRPGQCAAVLRRRWPGSRRAARAAHGLRARGQRGARHAGIPALHGQRDGEQPGAVPVDRGVEGQVPRPGSAHRRRRRCSAPTSSSTSGRSTATRRFATRCANGCSGTRRRIRCSCG